MDKLLNNPYGTSSIEVMVEENKAFIDKTLFIKTLDQLPSNYPILLRPRMFGKSTFVSMLEYFYDQSYLRLYDQIFSSTKIYQENLNSHNTYHVLSLDFSGLSSKSLEELLDKFSSELIKSIADFKARYPSFKCTIPTKMIGDPIVILNHFFTKYIEWSAKHPNNFPQDQLGYSDSRNLYIIIDEYDNFANKILNNDREFFKSITSKLGFLKEFYSTIKAATDEVVAKTFITGVSSISLDSITFGFNIAKNITTLPSFNEYAGITEQELRIIIPQLLDYKSFNIDLDYMVDNMRQAYNGYAFSKKAKQKLFNTSMCLRYIDELIAEQGYVDPNLDYDPAFNYDLTKLYDLIKYTDPIDLNRIIQTYYDLQVFEINKISESININQIDLYDYDTIISILFYMGYLTIKPEFEQNTPTDKLLLVCPNKYMRQIFRKCFVKYYFYSQDDFLKNFSFNLSCIENNEDDLSPFIKSCEEYQGGRLTNQHLIRMTESELVAILKTKLESENKITFKDEFPIQVPSIGERFIDLYIENKAYNSSYILEFKYISKAALQKNPKLIEQKKNEAKEQLLIYKQATIFKNRDVRAYSIIFMDCQCVHHEKI